MANTKSKLYSLIVIITIVFLVAMIQIDRGIIERHIATENKQAYNDLYTIKSRLTYNIYNNSQVIKSLPALFAVDPSLTQESFALATNKMFDEHNQLRNIAAAPDLIISYMYPIQGNEKAIGVDYRTLPDQIDSVLKAKDSRDLVLSGPLELIQGGTGIISRIPVFLKDEKGKEFFWGIVSAVIDANLFYQRSGLFDENLPLEIAIRGKDGLGEKGDVFFGDPELFNQKNITSTITLPYGSWQLAAKPIAGWGVLPTEIWQVRLAAFAIGLTLYLVLIASIRASMNAAISNLKFKNLIEGSPVPHALNNKKQQITYLNHAFIKTFGYTLEDIPTLEDWWCKAYPNRNYRKKIRSLWESYYNNFQASNEIVSPLEVDIQCKDGSIRTALVSLPENNQIDPSDFPVILYDITDRKQAEIISAQKEEQLLSFYKLGLVGLTITSPEKGWLRINNRLCQMLEYTEQELHNMTWAELTYPDDLAADVEQFSKLLANEIEGYSLEKRFVSRTGKIIPTNLVVSCVRKPNGQVDYVTAMVQDISERKQAEEKLVEAEKRLQLSQSAGGIGTWEVDLVTNKQTWSDVVTQQLGFPDLAEPTWEDFLNTVHPEDQEHVIQKTNEHLYDGLPLDIEYKIIDVSGKVRWMRSIGKAEFDDGKPIILRGTVQEVTAQKAAEEKLQLSSRVFSDTREGILITDTQRNIIDVNPAFIDITGYSREEVLGKNPGILGSDQQSPKFYQDMWQKVDNDGHWQGEIWNRTKAGELYAELLNLSTVTDDNEKLLYYVGVFSDITHSKQQQEELHRMAHYDVLTQLPNRLLFTDRFHQAIAHSKRTRHQLAICFLDLDHFKPINDTYGHEVGDTLLVEVAQRITANIREEDTVSRQGGDEFALLLSEIESFAQCEYFLERLLASLAEPYIINEVTHNITASIGVTLYPFDDVDFDTLLRHADQAMYQAKKAGRNRHHLFSVEQEQQDTYKYHRLDEIQQALTNNEFQLYYQPKVNMATGDVFGVEALIRWNHPEKGLIPPLEFLPILERTHIEIQLGNWVIEQALSQLEQWVVQETQLEVSVNIASYHLQSSNFIEKLEEAFTRHPEVDRQHLQLEILESSALSDINAVTKLINTCQEKLGLSVALDDFGTGYSSLTHLRHLPAQVVKIDQSFIRDMLDDPNDYAIIDGVMGLAEAFNREVIAEGVETTRHGLMLLNMGCEKAQGYGIAKPMPADDLSAWLKHYTPNQEWIAYENDIRTDKDDKLELYRITSEQWLVKFKAVIQASEDNVEPAPIMNPTQCHCGTWFKRVRQEHLFEDTWMHKLESEHDKVHLIANDLLNKYHNGNVDAARQGLAKLQSNFDEMSNTLGMSE